MGAAAYDRFDTSYAAARRLGRIASDEPPGDVGSASSNQYRNQRIPRPDSDAPNRLQTRETAPQRRARHQRAPNQPASAPTASPLPTNASSRARSSSKSSCGASLFNGAISATQNAIDQAAKYEVRNYGENCADHDGFERIDPAFNDNLIDHVDNDRRNEDLANVLPGFA